MANLSDRKIIVTIFMISGKEIIRYCDKVATNETGVYLYNFEPSYNEAENEEGYYETVIGHFSKRNIAGWYSEENPDYEED